MLQGQAIKAVNGLYGDQSKAFLRHEMFWLDSTNVVSTILLLFVLLFCLRLQTLNFAAVRATAGCRLIKISSLSAATKAL